MPSDVRFGSNADVTKATDEVWSHLKAEVSQLRTLRPSWAPWGHFMSGGSRFAANPYRTITPIATALAMSMKKADASGRMMKALAQAP